MTTHPSRPRRRPFTRLAVLAACSALVLAGCGENGDDEAIEPAAGTTSSASAEPTDGASPTDGATGTAEGTDGVSDGSAASDVALTSAREEVFSVLSPWNTSVVDDEVHAASEYMLEQAKIRRGVDIDGNPVTEPVEEGVYVNTQAWTVPVVAGGEPTTVTCRQHQCGDGSDDITLSIPDGVDPDPRYDGWYTIFDEAENKAYDLWRARREDDGTISYQFMRQWDLDGPGFNQPYVVSARGSGLPMFAGLIRPGELERCQINHALAISVPGPAAGNFIQPASSTDGNGRENSLPEGARIRLQRGFQLETPVNPVTGRDYPMTAQQSRLATCLVRTLQTYGAIVVDRAAVPTLYFQRLDSTRAPLLRGYELGSLGLEDFEVINFTPNARYDYPSQEEDVASSDLDDDLDVSSLTGGQ